MAIRVVVIDDAPFIREVVRHLLNKNGIQVVGEASDGDEGIEVVLREKPDVVLMDLVMPEKTGLEATKEILAKLPGTRILACSTVDQQSMVLSAIEAGCCGYLPKPFEGEQLLKMIQSSLEKKVGNL